MRATAARARCSVFTHIYSDTYYKHIYRHSTIQPQPHNRLYTREAFRIYLELPEPHIYRRRKNSRAAFVSSISHRRSTTTPLEKPSSLDLSSAHTQQQQQQPPPSIDPHAWYTFLRGTRSGRRDIFFVHTYILYNYTHAHECEASCYPCEFEGGRMNNYSSSGQATVIYINDIQQQQYITATLRNNFLLLADEMKKKHDDEKKKKKYIKVYILRKKKTTLEVYFVKTPNIHPHDYLFISESFVLFSLYSSFALLFVRGFVSFVLFLFSLSTRLYLSVLLSLRFCSLNSYFYFSRTYTSAGAHMRSLSHKQITYTHSRTAEIYSFSRALIHPRVCAVGALPRCSLFFFFIRFVYVYIYFFFHFSPLVYRHTYTRRRTETYRDVQREKETRTKWQRRRQEQW